MAVTNEFVPSETYQWEYRYFQSIYKEHTKCTSSFGILQIRDWIYNFLTLNMFNWSTETLRRYALALKRLVTEEIQFRGIQIDPKTDPWFLKIARYRAELTTKANQANAIREAREQSYLVRPIRSPIPVAEIEADAKLPNSPFVKCELCGNLWNGDAQCDCITRY